MTGWLMLAAVAAGLWLAGYWTACAVWPFMACQRCEGAGKRRSPSGRAWRPCPRCKGAGRRMRSGRKAWLIASGRRPR